MTVHVVNRMAPGGIETLVLDLMRKAKTRVVVFSLEGRRQELIDAWPALRDFENDIFAFDAVTDTRNFSVVPGVRRSLRQLKADRMFVHHIGPLLYGGIAGRLAGVRNLIHVEHDTWHYDQNPMHKHILRWCERLLKPQHFAVSDPIRQRLQELIKNISISVVPPGIDTKQFQVGDRLAARRRLGLSLSGRLIGTVGRLTAVKGHDVLINAMRHLSEDVGLVIVGDGEERSRLEQQVKDASLDDRVWFLGHRDDTAAIYPALDVFCLPSHNEGLPRVVIEAQACGLPVVASDVGAMRDAVFSDVGRLVSPGRVDELADGLRTVLEIAIEPEDIRAFVRDNYDFSITKQHYEAVPALAAGANIFPERASA